MKPANLRPLLPSLLALLLTTVPAGGLLAGPDDPVDFGELRETSPDSGRGPERRTPAPKPAKEKEYDRVDGGNQDGPREARDRLAKVIGTDRVGYDRETLARASTRDLQAMTAWFNQIPSVEPDFLKNAEHARGKMKGTLASQTNYSLYQARTAGWFDKQSDKDDYRVVMSFLQYAQDQNPPSPLLKNVADHLRSLLITAGPAYKVPLTQAEAQDLPTLQKKFERDLDKGAFQFAATYLSGLVIDSNAFAAAQKLAALPPGTIAELNRRQTRSDMDSGREAEARPEGGEFPEEAAARQAAEQAANRVSQAERAFADASAGLTGNGRWTREQLLTAMIENKSLDTSRLSAAAADLARARKAEGDLRREATRARKDGVTARQAGQAITTRMGQISQQLGDKPAEGVELSGPMASHRQRLTAALVKFREQDPARALFASRKDPAAVAQIVNMAARLDRAGSYQIAAEEGMGALAKQRAALSQAAQALQVPNNAPADLKAEVEKLKTELAAQSSANWEKSLWEQKTAPTVKAAAEKVAQDMAALGERMSAVAQKNGQFVDRERATTAVNVARASQFKDELASPNAHEVTLASPMPGGCKPVVKRGLFVAKKDGVRMGALPPGAKADIVGALLIELPNDETRVTAYRIAVPEAMRTMKRVTEGYVPPLYFAPADEAAFKEALASAKQGAGSAESTASTSSAAADKTRLLAEAQTQTWTRIQQMSADLQTNRLTFVLDLVDRSYPEVNACSFKKGLLDRVRQALQKYDAVEAGSVDAAAYSQLDAMARQKQLSNMGLETDAGNWGRAELRKLETILKACKATPPPAFYRWGQRIVTVEARD